MLYDAVIETDRAPEVLQAQTIANAASIHSSTTNYRWLASGCLSNKIQRSKILKILKIEGPVDGLLVQMKFRFRCPANFRHSTYLGTITIMY
jgi:hypothetical protein